MARKAAEEAGVEYIPKVGELFNIEST